MGVLQEIFDKLNHNADFYKRYDITMEKIYREELIRVVRKKKPRPPEGKYVYNPNIYLEDSLDYKDDLCFDICCYTDYLLFKSIRITACQFRPNDDAHERLGFGIGEPQYKKDITISNFDIDEIIMYIVNTEFNIIRSREDKTTYLTPNEYRCVDCQRKMATIGFSKGKCNL